MQRPPDKNIQDQQSYVNEVADVFVWRDDVNEERQYRYKYESDQVDAEHRLDVQSDLVAMITVEELHQNPGAHGHAENDHDAGNQLHELGCVQRPVAVG